VQYSSVGEVKREHGFLLDQPYALLLLLLLLLLLMGVVLLLIPT
jgi:hypothetical protein